MAEITPFRAWRYNPEIGPIKELISLVSNESKELYQNPFNSIHLYSPKIASEIKDRLREWESKNIIQQDPSPSIYVHYQYYKAENQQELKCLKGFICNIKIHEFSEHIILKHENTSSESIQKKLKILEETEINICPTHGLYSDEQLHLESYMDECIEHPIYEFTDQRDIDNKVGIINDPNVIEIFRTQLKSKQIIIADGHHRYTASLEYQKKLLLNNNLPTDHPANYHCMYLTNTESNDINILPTYRLIKNIKNFSETDFIKKLKENFLIDSIDSQSDITNFINNDKNTIGILLNNTTILVTLKSKNTSDWNIPDNIKELDVAIAEHFIIEKILGLSQGDKENISFETNLMKTIEYINREEIQIAIITKAVSIDEVKSICYKGLTLPYKSTYFYPKVLRGIVFNSLNN